MAHVLIVHYHVAHFVMQVVKVLPTVIFNIIEPTTKRTSIIFSVCMCVMY